MTLRSRALHRAAGLGLLALAVVACGGGGPAAETADPAAPGSPASPSQPSQPASPVVGNPSGGCAVPAAAQPRDVSRPTTVVGNGTPASCTSAAVVAAVAGGGVVTFDCGPDPVTITLAATARVFNDKPDLVLDGGGKVTLSGGGVRRILYQNACDPALVWTSTRCDLQATPRTTVQNIAFVDGNATGQNYGIDNVYGGGAIFARSGQLAIVNARFERNRCEATGPDMGGGAVRVRDMATAPAQVAGSTFGGAPGAGNACSNGGALSALASSYAVHNSVFTHNEATGRGQNPAIAGTPGGGLGGAIYMDGNRIDLASCGNTMRDNRAGESAGAIFFVSNDRSGTIAVRRSTLAANPGLGRSAPNFDTQPGMFVIAAPGQPVIESSTLQP